MIDPRSSSGPEGTPDAPSTTGAASKEPSTRIAPAHKRDIRPPTQDQPDKKADEEKVEQGTQSAAEKIDQGAQRVAETAGEAGEKVKDGVEKWWTRDMPFKVKGKL